MFPGRVAILLISVFIVVCVGAVVAASQFWVMRGLNTEASPTTENSKLPPIVIRIDDIQDYAFRNASLQLMEHNLAGGIPMSLAVIPYNFGSDRELVEKVSSAIKQGSEVTAHGWQHENFTQYTLDEQTKMMQMSEEKLYEALGVKVKIFTPPKFSFNSDTISAMKRTGYTIITSDISAVNPGLVSGVVSIPATVYFSNIVNGTWQLESLETLTKEVSKSIELHGYAIIVLHPQEFLQEKTLDQKKFESYKTVIVTLRQNYSFTTIEKLETELKLTN